MHGRNFFVVLFIVYLMFFFYFWLQVYNKGYDGNENRNTDVGDSF